MWLEHEDLLDTERHVGCLVFFQGKVGLSFKGLESPLYITIAKREYEFQPGTFQPLAMSDSYAAAIRKALLIWHAWQALIDAESDLAVSTVQTETARAILNREYEEFISRYGWLHANVHLFKFDGTIDCRLGLLPALENPIPDTQDYEKAPCFRERTYFPPERAEGQIYFDPDINERLTKAYARVMGELNEVDIDRIAELCGIDPDVAEDGLVDDLKLIVREPILVSGSGHRGSIVVN